MRSPSSPKNFGKRSLSTRSVGLLITNADRAKSTFFVQLSQQQSIDNQVSQLAVSFDADFVIRADGQLIERSLLSTHF